MSRLASPSTMPPRAVRPHTRALPPPPLPATTTAIGRARGGAAAATSKVAAAPAACSTSAAAACRPQEGRGALRHTCGRRTHIAPSRCAPSAGAATTTADAPAYLSPEEAKATLSSEQADDWQACARLLADHDVPENDIDRLIAKGFAWTSRAHFGPKKANVPPQPDNVMDVLQFLQGELGISPGADLVKVVKAFPEVLSCSIEELLRPNVARFEKEWFMKGPVLAKAIVRKPTLLGLYVDCSTVGSGSCMGQCSKCWSAN